jgi:hypothetical protein
MMEKLFHTIFWSSVQAAHTQAPRPDLSELKSIGKVGGLITECILSLSLSLCVSVVALPYPTLQATFCSKFGSTYCSYYIMELLN